MFLTQEKITHKIKKLVQNAETLDIAVAFWGYGAFELLGLDQIDKENRKNVRIICNLGHGGTNPSEIENLIKQKFEVRHLNTLHAKTYISEKAIIVGSANASANGLGHEASEIDSWEESAIFQTDNQVIHHARNWFEELYNRSKCVTPEYIKEAKNIWGKRRTQRKMLYGSKDNISLLEVIKSTPNDFRDKIVITCYEGGSLDKNAEKTAENFISNNKLIEDTITFFEDWESELTVRDKYIISFKIKKKGGIFKTTFELAKGVSDVIQVNGDQNLRCKSIYLCEYIDDIMSYKFTNEEKDQIFRLLQKSPSFEGANNKADFEKDFVTFLEETNYL